MNTPIANIDTRASDQPLDFALRCFAETAGQFLALRLGTQIDRPFERLTAKIVIGSNPLDSKDFPVKTDDFIHRHNSHYVHGRNR